MSTHDDTRADEAGDAPASPARRDLLRLLAAVPLSQFAIRLEDVERAAGHAAAALDDAQSGAQFRPRFFTADEWRLVRMLSDLVIPRDERSGSATDAGVPEFMDFILTAYPSMQKPMRDGLAWLNQRSAQRFDRPFVDATAAQRTELLDAIAYPRRARSSDQAGVEFFSRFRDLTASGFWSSRIGVADLQYMGNRAQAAWNGCPPAALAKLGVRYS